MKNSNHPWQNQVFTNWSECQDYVKGRKGVSFKKFESEQGAYDFLDGNTESTDSRILGMSREDFKQQYRASDDHKPVQKVTTYCDGSSLGNGTHASKAGYGVYFPHNPSYNISKPLLIGPQTNNRAEIMAVSEALDTIWNDLTCHGNKVEYTIKTDSEYVSKLLNDRYSSYTEKEMETLPNKDLVKPLIEKYVKVKTYYDVNKDKFSNDKGLKIEWVKGHAGEPGNEMADLLARRGADQRN